MLHSPQTPRPIPPKPLARLRAAWATYQTSKAHFEDLLNAVAETLGIDTDVPGIQTQLEQGVILVPDAPAPHTPPEGVLGKENEQRRLSREHGAGSRDGR
jgi:hypothetical protein